MSVKENQDKPPKTPKRVDSRLQYRSDTSSPMSISGSSVGSPSEIRKYRRIGSDDIQHRSEQFFLGKPPPAYQKELEKLEQEFRLKAERLKAVKGELDKNDRQKLLDEIKQSEQFAKCLDD